MLIAGNEIVVTGAQIYDLRWCSLAESMLGFKLQEAAPGSEISKEELNFRSLFFACS